MHGVEDQGDKTRTDALFKQIKIENRLHEFA
jgi:hypothetical protein